MFHGTGESKIGKAQILLHLFVPHTILPIVEFTGFMSQKDGKSKLKQIDKYHLNEFFLEILE